MSATGFPDPSQDFEGYQASLFKSLLAATGAVNAIPVDDVGFFRSLDAQFQKDITAAGTSSLSIANTLLQQCSTEAGIDGKDIEDIDDIKHRYNLVTEVCDGLLEKTDLCLDQLNDNKQGSDAQKKDSLEVTKIATKSNIELKFLRSNNITRPQIHFKDAVDNSNVTPFERKIKHKPHAVVPLTYESRDPTKSLPHPYEHEIANINYPENMFKVTEPEMYQPLEETSYTFVDTEEALLDMMKALEGAEELAVDLEHHNYRSYQGFTCLMQLSTRDQDFIVDTLSLRDKLWMLNEYFADPSIVKVLHGADSDIIWLQRDFGLYIVNLFDTYFPTKVLEFPHHSLAYLLKKYCNFDADKQYQLADWRIRPLPEEMLRYARCDTHFLLYIYDHLRNELLEKSATNDNLMRNCLQRSNGVALQKFDKEVYDVEDGEGPNGWKNMLKKWKYSINPQQLAVFKALHSWRDHTAREGDESVRYVLPNHMLLSLMERMPTDSSGVIGCCTPCPPLVRMDAQALGLLIQNAKIGALDKSKTPATAATTTSKQPANASTTKSEEPVAADKSKITKKQVKRPIELVDPSVFDLEQVKKIRIELNAKLEKTTSALFGAYL